MSIAASAVPVDLDKLGLFFRHIVAGVDWIEPWSRVGDSWALLETIGGCPSLPADICLESAGAGVFLLSVGLVASSGCSFRNRKRAGTSSLGLRTFLRTFLSPAPVSMTLDDNE